MKKKSVIYMQKRNSMTNQIEEEKLKLKIEIKVNLKRMIIFIFNTTLFVMGGSYLFLYIEHCYDVQKPKRPQVERNYLQLCRHLRAMNLGMSTENHTIIEEIEELCRNQLIAEKTEIQCNFNVKSVNKWNRFAMSIAFTTGK